MGEATLLLVFGSVLALRLLVPLAIPRYPLPAILAAPASTASTRPSSRRFTDARPDGYQGYDKALDIYYLTIAYIATLRNWTNRRAFEVSRFLLYYRLVGVVLFEFSQVARLLLLFPNTFEYFFDFYEAVRVRWDPRRMTNRLVHRRGGVHLDRDQAAPGVHDPRRPGGHHGLDQDHHLRRGGLRLRGEAHRQPAGGDPGLVGGGGGPHPRGAVAVHPPAAARPITPRSSPPTRIPPDVLERERTARRRPRPFAPERPGADARRSPWSRWWPSSSPRCSRASRRASSRSSSASPS